MSSALDGLSRSGILRDAETAVNGERQNQYGPPSQDFQRTADALSAFGFRVHGEPLKAHHVAIIMSLLKLSRLMWGSNKRDTWVDLAGYAACGHECVVQEQETQNGCTEEGRSGG